LNCRISSRVVINGLPGPMGRADEHDPTLSGAGVGSCGGLSDALR
jgi:hypothetical protein